MIMFIFGAMREIEELKKAVEDLEVRVQKMQGFMIEFAEQQLRIIQAINKSGEINMKLLNHTAGVLGDGGG